MIFSENRYPPSDRVQGHAFRDHALARRQTLKCLQAVWDGMEGLLVDGVDRHLRCAKESRIVERSDFKDDHRQIRSSRCEMGPAFAAKLTRDRVFEIGTRE